MLNTAVKPTVQTPIKGLSISSAQSSTYSELKADSEDTISDIQEEEDNGLPLALSQSEGEPKDRYGTGRFDEHIYAVKRVELKDSSEDYMNRILNEVKNLGKVRSEYVVQYYNSWLETNFLYIQMEFCSQNLRNILEIKPKEFDRDLGEAMSSYEYFISCEIFRQILESVQYLHELNPQIIHRDLKPDNILIDGNGRNGRFVKLCDFGVAKVHQKNINKTYDKYTTGVGTPKYQAPEIAQDPDTYCRKSLLRE
ncbi:unnamed protein product [Oppiella nova]|uniref:Protein kinase domain-containing protein n=1 Tax=Oppiella nova TaxID=334625 RepID=A0A7R9QRI5_9ACAR|nr:unnamed protein product [Oppiella nova]CAG2171689.1 unnamed protein product [Oppiella nova]